MQGADWRLHLVFRGAQTTHSSLGTDPEWSEDTGEFREQSEQPPLRQVSPLPVVNSLMKWASDAAGGSRQRRATQVFPQHSRRPAPKRQRTARRGRVTEGRRRRPNKPITRSDCVNLCLGVFWAISMTLSELAAASKEILHKARRYLRPLANRRLPRLSTTTS